MEDEAASLSPPSPHARKRARLDSAEGPPAGAAAAAADLGARDELMCPVAESAELPARDGAGASDDEAPSSSVHSDDLRDQCYEFLCENSNQIPSEEPSGPAEMVTEIMERTVSGSFLKSRGRTFEFSGGECVLIAAQQGDLQAALLDRVCDSQPEGVPLHVLCYRLFRDPHMPLEGDLDALVCLHTCPYGRDASGFRDLHYVCVNPQHYRRRRGVAAPESSDASPVLRRTSKASSAASAAASPPGSRAAAAALAAAAAVAADPLPIARGVARQQGHSPDEYRWLCEHHLPQAFARQDSQRAGAEPMDVIKRILEKIHTGRLTRINADGGIEFEKESCVLMQCSRESRSTVRMDVANLASKCWPQALAYKIWRDPFFLLREWQSLRNNDGCQFGYAGPKCAGSGGWMNNSYICINPFHYDISQVSQPEREAPVPVAAAVQPPAFAAGFPLSALAGHGEPQTFTLDLTSVLGDLVKNPTKVPVAAGDTVFSAGDATKTLYVLVSGGLNMFTQEGQAIERIVPGSLFGEVSFFLDMPRLVTVKAVEASEVACLDYHLCKQKFLNDADVHSQVVELARRRHQTIVQLSTRSRLSMPQMSMPGLPGPAAVEAVGAPPSELSTGIILDIVRRLGAGASASIGAICAAFCDGNTQLTDTVRRDMEGSLLTFLRGSPFFTEGPAGAFVVNEVAFQQFQQQMGMVQMQHMQAFQAMQQQQQALAGLAQQDSVRGQQVAMQAYQLQQAQLLQTQLQMQGPPMPFLGQGAGGMFPGLGGPAAMGAPGFMVPMMPPGLPPSGILPLGRGGGAPFSGP